MRGARSEPCSDGVLQLAAWTRREEGSGKRIVDRTRRAALRCVDILRHPVVGPSRPAYGSRPQRPGSRARLQDSTARQHSRSDLPLQCDTDIPRRGPISAIRDGRCTGGRGWVEAELPVLGAVRRGGGVQNRLDSALAVPLTRSRSNLRERRAEGARRLGPGHLRDQCSRTTEIFGHHRRSPCAGNSTTPPADVNGCPNACRYGSRSASCSSDQSTRRPSLTTIETGVEPAFRIL